eukprot:TRINITY_DN5739_c0_g1_i1.p1 TRINITY_DN5739_c0_g1~~TRINITY_DN5739_c0_g1_i1.p1  ORF type:complete len:1203 (+),score=398.96 TRINITY_DN5739_c0_g1_i1:89-3610(+)
MDCSPAVDGSAGRWTPPPSEVLPDLASPTPATPPDVRRTHSRESGPRSRSAPPASTPCTGSPAYSPDTRPVPEPEQEPDVSTPPRSRRKRAAPGRPEPLSAADDGWGLAVRVAGTPPAKAEPSQQGAETEESEEEQEDLLELAAERADGAGRDDARPVVVSPGCGAAEIASGRASVVLQTQRWFPVAGWGKGRLPTDPAEWVDAQNQPRPRDAVQPPPRCKWAGEWVVEGGVADPDGWEYATDWWLKFHSPGRTGDCVRRRRWKREWTADPTAADADDDVVLARRPGEQLGLDFKGLKLVRVLSGTPAAECRALERHVGRRLVAINGQPVSADAEVADRVGQAATVALRFERPAEGAALVAPLERVHKLFPGLSPDEKPVESFQCNFGNHRVGRLYIFPDRIGFYSLIGDPFLVPYERFVRLDKKSSWGILEAIHIKLRGAQGGTAERLQFTAFLSRDQAFQLLERMVSLYRARVAEGLTSAGADSARPDFDDAVSVGTAETDPVPVSAAASASGGTPEEDALGGRQGSQADGLELSAVCASTDGSADAPEQQQQQEVADKPAHHRKRGPYVVSCRSSAVVRQGPGLDTPIVARVPNGTQVEVAEVQARRARIVAPHNGWVSVALQDGTPILTAVVDAKPRSLSEATQNQDVYVEFRRLFPDLHNVQLVDNFQCSFKAGKIGRMWIGQTVLCFSSPLLATPIVLPLDTIADVVRKQDRWVLSAIEILTQDDTFLFTAFMHRDRAYGLLRDLFLQHHKKLGRDPEQLCRAARRRLAERERAREEEKTRARKEKKERGKSRRGQGADEALERCASGTDADCEMPEPSGGGAADVDTVPTFAASQSEAHTAFADTRLDSCFSAHQVLLGAEPMCRATKLPQGATLDQVFSWLYKDGTPFLTEVKSDHGEYVGTKDSQQKVPMPKWEMSADGASGVRELTCTTVVQAPWTSHTRFEEKQRWVCVAGPPRTLLVQTSAQTPDVTMGDCFRVEAVTVIEEVAPGQCEARMHGYVHFLKSTLLRGKILSTAMQNMTAAHQRVLAMLTRTVRLRLAAAAGAPPPAAEPEAVEEPPPPPPPRSASAEPSKALQWAIAGAATLCCASVLWSVSAAVQEQRKAAAALAELTERMLDGDQPQAAAVAAVAQGHSVYAMASLQLASALCLCCVCGCALTVAMLLRR